jgi:diaminopimelate decarboxylase
VTVQDRVVLSGEWPPLASHAAGRMLVDGCDMETLAGRYGTPLWIFSLRTVAANYRQFVDTWSAAYPLVECAYSMKANHLVALVQLLADLGARFDCTGETEMQIARVSGAAPGSVILNGNGKSDAALRLAARDGVRQVNLDSMEELRRLERFAQVHGSVVDCAVRVQLGYRSLLDLDPSFEPMLKVWEGKFGVSVATGEAKRVIDAAVTSPHLRFAGLHHHVGFSAVTGAYDPELDVLHHREATRELCAFAATLDVAPDRLDLGGGFPVGSAIGVAPEGISARSALRPLLPLKSYADAITSVVRESFPADRLPILQFEAGRFQVQNAGLFVARVVDVKRRHADPPRTVVTVDGSMQQCTQLGFGRTRPLPVIPGSDLGADLELCDIVGQTCVYDALAEGVPLPPVGHRDLVVFPSHGAYAEVSGTNFNAMPRPACVVVDRGLAALAKRRERFMDVIVRHSGRALEWEPA